jgi:ferredoxin
VAACPIGAMLWHPGSRAPFKCVSCGACVRTCPKGALGMVSKEGSA